MSVNKVLISSSVGAFVFAPSPDAAWLLPFFGGFFKGSSSSSDSAMSSSSSSSSLSSFFFFFDGGFDARFGLPFEFFCGVVFTGFFCDFLGF
jgi:hypothetical protein